jgi:hypothetical protein
MKRSGFKPRTKPMRRGKALGPGKKTHDKRKAMTASFEAYYARHGWEDSDGVRWVPCQLTGLPVSEGAANLHHKTPRSELRKAGCKNVDAPHRLIVCHYGLHLAFIHERNGMGRPKDPDKARRFAMVEQDAANSANGLQVKLEGQDKHDLERLISKGASRG